MGNCLFGGMGGGEEQKVGEEDRIVQVVTANGGIMEFHSPMTAGLILEEFPGHAIFKSDDLFWKPLPNCQHLHAGDSYLLLPLHRPEDAEAGAFEVKVGHVRSKSIPFPSVTCIGTTPGGAAAPAPAPAPYRMSFDSKVLKRSNTDVFSRYHKATSTATATARGGGVWKVKLAISPEQLVEILSQEARTQELIDSVRTVAKCGATRTASSSASSLGFSDQWSIASSRPSSNQD